MRLIKSVLALLGTGLMLMNAISLSAQSGEQKRERERKEAAIPKKRIITERQIKVSLAGVVNFSDLARFEKLHPVKPKRHFIEQGEDREKDEKLGAKKFPVKAINYYLPDSMIHPRSPERNSPEPSGYWNGVADNNTLIPPDIQGAVGITYALQTTNQQFNIYTKSGTLVNTITITNLFSSTGGTGYFDPHCVYDVNYSRYVIASDGYASDGNSGLFIAVSETNDPTGSWYVYGFDALSNAADFLDYPLLGYNTNWVVVTGNDFLSSGGIYGEVYVMDRASLYSGTVGTVNNFTDNLGWGDSPAETRNITQTTEYLVQDWDGDNGGLGQIQVESITGTATDPVYSEGVTISVNNPWSETAVNANQEGNTNQIDIDDTRTADVIYLNSSLWFAHTVFLPANNPTYSGVDWWQLNPSNNSILQYERLADPNGVIFYYYPSISANSYGDALLGYCTSSSGTYASAAYSYHASTDPLSSMESSYTYKSGLAGYYKTYGGGRNRWGDFTGTTTDPVDNSFWNFSQWANTGNDWGTVIAHVPVGSSSCTANAAFSYTTTTSCSAPFTVTFLNLSSDADTFLWNFGDGTTSTELNPSHTYTSYGSFSVKLVASGSSCAMDSTIIDSLVTVSSSIPCVVIMPASGSYSTQTACTGTIYDDGGPDGNISAFSNSTLTISPTGAANVKLHFLEFDIEPYYDYLDVYDGPSTNSPLIASLTGSSLPANITSSGPSITLQQFTDESANADTGYYELTWTCTVPSAKPTVAFTADTSSCTGVVQFDNRSAGATSWIWHFGDGTTSTLQNPSHFYIANGTYTVSLVGTNAYGSDSVSEVNYITISKPAAPNTTGASGCKPGQYTLSATSSDTINWYTSLTDSIPVFTGNPFVTPAISTTATYYAEALVAGPTYEAGPVNSSIGGSSYLATSPWYQIFNVLKPCTLHSVYVYAEGAGDRTFQLLNDSGAVMASTTVNIPNGGSTVTLNFNLPVGNSYQLGVPASSTIYLLRNSSGAVYPYADAGGYVNIIGNTADQVNRWYYFYNWIIQSPPCTSLRAATTATISSIDASISSVIEPSCFGYSNGSATATSTGGIPALTYKWSNNQTGLTATNLSAGTVNVTVTDSIGCSATASKTISQPTALSVTLSAVNVSCNGGTNGRINLVVTGGTPGYTYNWGSDITSQNRTGLIAGTYTVTVTDSAGCTATATKTITQPNLISPTLTATNVSCNGGNNGAITLTATGGTSPYTYNWGNNVTSANRSNLVAGIYTVTITDSLDCSVSASKTITQPAAISVVPTVTNVSCNGGNNGSINLTVTGGTPGYTYNWGSGVTTQNRSELAAGTYSVTITDAANCTATFSEGISQPAAISIVPSATNVSCNGGNNGAINLMVSGGTSPYTYAWGNGITSQNRTGLISGTYNVTVTDSAGCTVTASKTISQPTAIEVSVTVHNTVCNQDNGSAIVGARGGTPGYSYLWNTNATDSSVSGLAAGNYYVTVTDHNHCQSTDSVVVNYSSSLLTNLTYTDVSCYGSADGSASISAIGGAAPFRYLWSTGATDSSINDLPAGQYTVVVSDSNHCSGIDSFTITQPGPILLSLNIISPSCYLYSNGSVTASAGGGVPNYSFAWSNNATGDSIGNLPAGNYSVTVRDGNNCTTDSDFVIYSPAALNLSYTAKDVSCFGEQDGNISLAANGGTAPYSYKWNTGSANDSIGNLGAGNYFVTVTDDHRCTASDSIFVSQPGQFYISTSSTNTALNQNTGTATVNVNGGVEPYAFNWSNGDSAQSISGLAVGTYSVTVTDKNGCQQTGTVEVGLATGLAALPADIPFSLHPNPANTRVIIEIPGLEKQAAMQLYDALGQMLLSQTISAEKTILDISMLSQGVYSIELKQGDIKTVRQLVVTR